MSRFADKGIVVTGAAQGIGLGLVRLFLDEGAGVSSDEQQYDPTSIINELRRRVEQWRAIPNPAGWRVTTLLYNPGRNLSGLVNPLGQRTTYLWQDNLPVGVIDALGRRTTLGYTSLTNKVNVANNFATRSDFALAAGHLAIKPTSISKKVPFGEQTTAKLTVKNDGSAPADVQLVDEEQDARHFPDPRATTAPIGARRNRAASDRSRTSSPASKNPVR